MSDEKKQLEITAETLKGLMEDAVANRLAPELKSMREDILNNVPEALDALMEKRKEAKKDVFVPEEKKDGEAVFKSFGEQARAVYDAWAAPHKIDKRLMELNAKAPSGMSEMIGSDGGFLLEPGSSQELYRNVIETGVLLSACRRIPVSGASNVVPIPGIDETSRVDGSRWGGVSASWEGEGETIGSSKIKTRKIIMTLNKLTGLAYVTDEMVQDVPMLNSILPQAFGEEFAYRIDSAIYSGNGGGKPLGILNAPATVSVAKEAGQAAATVVAENVMKMWSRCISRSRANAQWLINQDVEPQLFGLNITVGTGGIPIWLPANGLSGQPFSTLFGRPVKAIEQASTIGTTGDIFFADLSQYAFAEKGGMNSAISMHFKFDTAQTGYRFIMRADGQPLWQKPLTPASGSSNTLSPFVKLDTRA